MKSPLWTGSLMLIVSAMCGMVALNSLNIVVCALAVALSVFVGFAGAMLVALRLTRLI